jgi:hypothetical protein
VTSFASTRVHRRIAMTSAIVNVIVVAFRTTESAILRIVMTSAIETVIADWIAMIVIDIEIEMIDDEVVAETIEIETETVTEIEIESAIDDEVTATTMTATIATIAIATIENIETSIENIAIATIEIDTAMSGDTMNVNEVETWIDKMTVTCFYLVVTRPIMVSVNSTNCFNNKHPELQILHRNQKQKQKHNNHSHSNSHSNRNRNKQKRNKQVRSKKERSQAHKSHSLNHLLMYLSTNPNNTYLSSVNDKQIQFIMSTTLIDQVLSLSLSLSLCVCVIPKVNGSCRLIVATSTTRSSISCLFPLFHSPHQHRCNTMARSLVLLGVLLTILVVGSLALPHEQHEQQQQAESDSNDVLSQYKYMIIDDVLSHRDYYQALNVRGGGGGGVVVVVHSIQTDTKLTHTYRSIDPCAFLYCRSTQMQLALKSEKRFASLQ